MNARAVAWNAAALAILAPAAWACGVCIEDKVAATYDHAVVQRASAAGKVVVYCEIDGPVDDRRIRNAVRTVRGLDPASLRISSQPAALSFALDNARQSPQQAVAAIEQGLAAGTRLGVVRLVMPARAAAAPVKAAP